MKLLSTLFRNLIQICVVSEGALTLTLGICHFLLAWASLDVVPLTEQRNNNIDCCLFDYKLCIHTPTLPLILIFLSLFSNIPWSTLSNAFGKSKWITSTLFDFSNSSNIMLRCSTPVAGRGRICQSGSHVALGSFANAFLGIGGYFLLIFFPVFFLSVM